MDELAAVRLISQLLNVLQQCTASQFLISHFVWCALIRMHVAVGLPYIML